MENKKWRDWITEIRTGEKMPRKNQLVLLLLAGILLLVIAIPVSKPSEETLEDTQSAQSTAIQDTGDYEEYLERKTGRVLEDVGGVGEGTVMITVK